MGKLYHSSFKYLCQVLKEKISNKKNIVLILFLVSNLMFAQNIKIENNYIRKVRILGLSFKEVFSLNKKSKFISFFDSTYKIDVIINKTVPQGYTKVKGKYYQNGNKIVLLKKNKRYRIFNIKPEYLLNNILFGIIRDEYYPTINE